MNLDELHDRHRPGERTWLDFAAGLHAYVVVYGPDCDELRRAGTGSTIYPTRTALREDAALALRLRDILIALLGFTLAGLMLLTSATSDAEVLPGIFLLTVTVLWVLGRARVRRRVTPMTSNESSIA